MKCAINYEPYFELDFDSVGLIFLKSTPTTEKKY